MISYTDQLTVTVLFQIRFTLHNMKILIVNPVGSTSSDDDKVTLIADFMLQHTEDVGIIAATQPHVTCKDDGIRFSFLLLQIRMSGMLDGRQNFLHGFFQIVCIFPVFFHVLFLFLQLTGGYQLHRLRNLFGRFYRADARLDLQFTCCHTLSFYHILEFSFKRL